MRLPSRAPPGSILAALGLTSVATAIFAIRPFVARSYPEGAVSSRTEGLMDATSRDVANQLRWAAGTLAVSVLLDSSIEHARGAFKNRAMYAPIVIAGVNVLTNMLGRRSKSRAARFFREDIYAATCLTGGVGTAFHVRNVLKAPGGLSWQNLFYRAPLGAPAAISLSGILGFLADRIGATPPDQTPSICGIPARHIVTTLSIGGMVGSAGEAGLLHLRGSYHNPLMVLPVTLPPIAACSLGLTQFSTSAKLRWMTKGWLHASAVLGLSGTVFHAIGIARDMHGWRNWQQNLFNGAPLPAPPAFTGLALAGLAALQLKRRR